MRYRCRWGYQARGLAIAPLPPVTEWPRSRLGQARTSHPLRLGPGFRSDLASIQKEASPPTLRISRSSLLSSNSTSSKNTLTFNITLDYFDLYASTITPSRHSNQLSSHKPSQWLTLLPAKCLLSAPLSFLPALGLRPAGLSLLFRTRVKRCYGSTAPSTMAPPPSSNLPSPSDSSAYMSRLDVPLVI